MIFFGFVLKRTFFSPALQTKGVRQFMSVVLVFRLFSLFSLCGLLKLGTSKRSEEESLIKTQMSVIKTSLKLF